MYIALNSNGDWMEMEEGEASVTVFELVDGTPTDALDSYIIGRIGKEVMQVYIEGGELSYSVGSGPSSSV